MSSAGFQPLRGDCLLAHLLPRLPLDLQQADRVGQFRFVAAVAGLDQAAEDEGVDRRHPVGQFQVGLLLDATEQLGQDGLGVEQRVEGLLVPTGLPLSAGALRRADGRLDQQQLQFLRGAVSVSAVK